MHAEANAIISAARSECIGGTLYRVGMEAGTNELAGHITPCSMCRRLIINAGIAKVVTRETPEKYHVTNVQDWVFNDDTILDPDFALKED